MTKAEHETHTEKELEERPDYERMSYMALGGQLRLPFAYGPVGAAQSLV